MLYKEVFIFQEKNGKPFSKYMLTIQVYVQHESLCQSACRSEQLILNTRTLQFAGATDTTRSAMVSALRFVALVATLTLTLTLTPSSSWGADAAATKVSCTDASVSAQYGAIQSKRGACEAATGVVMALPLAAKQKKLFCTQCPELMALTQAKSLPKCTVTANGEVMNLQQEFNRLFKPCLSGDSSDSAGADDTSGSAATVAPGGTDSGATTETPKTKTPKTPKPSKTKKNDASATGSSDEDDSTVTTTKAPKTPKPSKTAKTSTAGVVSSDAGSTDIESIAGSADVEVTASSEATGSLSGLPILSASGSSRGGINSKANATSGDFFRIISCVYELTRGAR